MNRNIQCVRILVFILLSVILWNSNSTAFQIIKEKNERWGNLFQGNLGGIQLNNSDSLKNLSIVSRWSWGACYASDVKNNFAYVGNGSLLQVLDISDANNPQLIREVLTRGIVAQLRVYKNYVISYAPLQVYDISNPYQPVLKFIDSTYAVVQKFYLNGDYLYLGDFSGGIQIVDLTNPTIPVRLGYMLASGEQVTGIAVKDTCLYAETVNGFFVDVFSIKDKNKPKFLLRYNIVGVGGDLFVSNNRLYIGQYSNPRLGIYDISVADSLKYLGGIDVGATPLAITGNNSLVYVSLGGIGFSIIDVSVPSNPRIISNTKAPHPRLGPQFCIVNSNKAFISTGLGFWIVDVRNPGTPKTDYFYSTSYNVTKIRTTSNYAFLDCTYGGLRVLDLSDIQHPQRVGEFFTSYILMDLVLNGDYAYLLTEKTVVVLNISDPRNIRKLSEFRITNNSPTSEGVAIKSSVINGRTFLFVIHPEIKLTVIDATDPTNLSIVDTIQTFERPTAIESNGNTLFVGYYDKKVEIYDIQHLPNSINKINEINNFESIGGLKVNGNILYVADIGLTIFNITNNLAPQKIGHVDTPGGRSIVDIALENEYILLAYWQNLEIIDVSNVTSPNIVAYRRGEDAFGVESYNNSILVGDNEKGMTIINIDLINNIHPGNIKPDPISLFQNYPNPFNPTTKISFSLPQKSQIKLKIFDALGRKIKIVADGVYEAGKHEVEFNAINLPSGVYFYNLTTGSNSITKKMLLMK
ncbi:MAG: T9SS type A sorting domain-containing protein [Bacteroidota bacterium]